MRRSVLFSLVIVGALLAAGCVEPPPPPEPEMCLAGTFSATGEAPCTPAPVGTFVDTDGATEATDCDLGRYQDEEGQTSCKLALPGTFVDVTGATSATLCPLGRFQPNSGAIECLIAPIGTYVDSIGAIAATDCPAGTTTASTGATSLSDCEALMLAVAYSNLDGIDGYDPTGTDVLISKLVDTNADGVASAGDMVETSQFPLNFDATAFGSFQSTSHELATVVVDLPAEQLTVQDASGGQFLWIDNVQGNGLVSYREWVPGAVLGINDWLSADPNFAEEIRIESGVPSAPDSAFFIQRPINPGEDTFLRIDFAV